MKTSFINSQTSVLRIHFVWLLFAIAKAQHDQDSYSEESKCLLPEQPANGYYQILGSSWNFGEVSVLSSTKLKYTCNDGFVITSKSDSECLDGYWTVKPTCERKKVICYVQNYKNFKAEDLNPKLCTHLIVVSSESSVTADNPWSDSRLKLDYSNLITDIKKFNPDIKAIISIGDWPNESIPSSESFDTIQKRECFANQTVKFLRDVGFDGLDLVWLYRGAQEKNHFTDLIKVLSITFYKYNLLLSAVISAHIEHIETAYNILEVNKQLDFITIFPFDLMGNKEQWTGVCSPLYEYDLGNGTMTQNININASVHTLLNLGVSNHKIMLGIGFFGTTKNFTELPDIAQCPPVAYKDAKVMPYHKICPLENDTTNQFYFSESALAPVLAKNDLWITFENKKSISYMVKFLDFNNLGGVSIYSAEMDDLNGSCNEGKSPLLTYIHEALSSAVLFEESNAQQLMNISNDSVVETTTLSNDVVTEIEDTLQTLPDNPSNECKLPKQPENGSYTIMNPPENYTDTVPLFTKLQYNSMNCKKGFVITSKVQPQCADGSWTVEPTCEGLKVVCYFTSFLIEPKQRYFTYKDLNPDLCTHLIMPTEINFEAIGVENPWKAFYNGDRAQILNALDYKTQNPDLKILVGVGGMLNDSSKFSKSLNTYQKRDSFAINTLKFLLDFGFDGLDLNWMYPGYRGGGPEDKDNFTALIRLLSLSFKKYNLTLAAVISGNVEILNSAYQIPEIDRYLDIITINTVDLLESPRLATGKCAPLYRNYHDKSLAVNTNASVHTLLDLGASNHKVMLTIGLFGITKSLSSDSRKSTCPPLSNYYDSSIVSYNELCHLEQDASLEHILFDDNLEPVTISGDTWVTHENKESLNQKVEYMKSNNLGGVSVYSIDMDDFKGACNIGKRPLLSFTHRAVTATEPVKVNWRSHFTEETFYKKPSNDSTPETSTTASPTTTNLVTERTTVIVATTTEKLERGCPLPSFPPDGLYEVKNSRINNRPGDIVPPFTFLVYKCNKDYYPSSNTSYCLKNLTWSASPLCSKKCSMPNSLSVDFTCFDSSGSQIICAETLDIGTVVKCRCKFYYKNIGSYYYEMTCKDGVFDVPPPKCEPECGSEPSVGETQIISGHNAARGMFPWHVSVYKKDLSSNPVQHDYICGASIIKTQLVMSAAHCFYSTIKRAKNPANLYAVAAGKLSIEWIENTSLEPQVQTSDVEKIFIPNLYKGEESSHHADIAVLKLVKSLEFSEVVHPICLNLNNDYLDKVQLLSGNFGKVAGWGKISETGGVSKELRYLNVPKIDDTLCFNETLQYNFVKYLTLDKLCGGYTNGSAVCKGDSGGGWVFPYSDSLDAIKRWYIRGIVSVTPSSNKPGFRNCNKDTYTAYTHVYHWKGWLSDLFNKLKV